MLRPQCGRISAPPLLSGPAHLRSRPLDDAILAVCVGRTTALTVDDRTAGPFSRQLRLAHQMRLESTRLRICAPAKVAMPQGDVGDRGVPDAPLASFADRSNTQAPHLAEILQHPLVRAHALLRLAGPATLRDGWARDRQHDGVATLHCRLPTEKRGSLASPHGMPGRSSSVTTPTTRHHVESPQWPTS